MRTWEVRDVFHGSLLKPYERDGNTSPPALLNDGEYEHELKKTLDHNDDADNERIYKFKWIVYEIPSWETETFLRNSKQLIDACFQESGKVSTAMKACTDGLWLHLRREEM